MKTLIKMSVASLVVFGTAQTHASEVELDIAQILANSVATFVTFANQELEESFKNTVSYNAETILNSLLQTTAVKNDEHTDITHLVVRKQ